MKHVFKIATLSLLCANAFATPVYHPAGPNLTYGAVSNNQSIISNITNPAAGAAVFVKEDSQYRFGILSSVGAGYEFGQVDNLYDEIDNTQSVLQDSQQLSITALCPSLPVVDATCLTNIRTEINQNVIGSVNSTLNTVQTDGYATVFASGHVPVMPIVISHKALGGSFVLDANATVVVKMGFLNDPLADLTDGQITSLVTGGTVDPVTGTLTYNLDGIADTDGTLLVKAGAVAELGLGYSRPVFKNDTGELMAGARVKYYKVGLSRTAQRLLSSTGSEDAFDADNNYTESSGFGVDVGALWISSFYRAGAWIDNINKPSFKFNGVDTTDYTDAAMIAALSKDEKYEMKTQLHLEGAMYTESQNWVVNVGLDANAINDPVGNEYQWATLSAGYATDSWWIPGFRVGYRANMAGTELSYLTAGITAFKSLTLDVAYGLDSVTIEGQTAPRSAILNLGLELSF